MEKTIILLDLNYTLVANQQSTRMLRPFSVRMAAENYRKDLIDLLEGQYVIMVTARPEYQKRETLINILRKMKWQPNEAYFNDINAMPPEYKESALKRFIFPRHGNDGSKYLAIESNPQTRAMYARYSIEAMPYEKYIKIYNQKENNTEDIVLF